MPDTVTCAQFCFENQPGYSNSCNFKEKLQDCCGRGLSSEWNRHRFPHRQIISISGQRESSEWDDNPYLPLPCIKRNGSTHIKSIKLRLQNHYQFALTNTPVKHQPAVSKTNSITWNEEISEQMLTFFYTGTTTTCWCSLKRSSPYRKHFNRFITLDGANDIS